MTTTFVLLADLCGLSQREAANFLKVRIDTVKSWGSGRRATPDAVLVELAQLAAAIDRAADERAKTLENEAAAVGQLPSVIELGLATDDEEARSIGWPCVGVHQAMLARVAAGALARGISVTITTSSSDKGLV